MHGWRMQRQVAVADGRRYEVGGVYTFYTTAARVRESDILRSPFSKLIRSCFVSFSSFLFLCSFCFFFFFLFSSLLSLPTSLKNGSNKDHLSHLRFCLASTRKKL